MCGRVFVRLLLTGSHVCECRSAYICANVPLTVIDFYCALLALLESRFACAAMLFN